MDLHDIVELLQTTARSVGAEVTSPWFYLQLGLILAATGISIAVGAAVRAKVNLGALLILALWLTNLASHFAENRINRSSDLTLSIQVLLVKMIRMGLMVVAIAIALGAVGINLSALEVFTGAAGVGIGLGLQKIVANFIS